MQVTAERILGIWGPDRYKATEKTVTLDVALLLRDYITERFPDVEIVMTREGDTYPKIRERSNSPTTSKQISS
jgi:N-acetylmuramoyl-L-alanine amidase